MRLKSVTDGLCVTLSLGLEACLALRFGSEGQRGEVPWGTALQAASRQLCDRVRTFRLLCV
jgi:hypothetical protein